MVQLRFILDSNLYLNYLLSPNPEATAVAFALEAAATGAALLILPADVMAELALVVAERPHLRKRVSPAQLEVLMHQVFEYATLVPELEFEPPSVARDQKDDYLVALAVMHEADLLVTRDKDLLSLRVIQGVQIIDPVSLLEMLRSRRK